MFEEVICVVKTVEVLGFIFAMLVVILAIDLVW